MITISQLARYAGVTVKSGSALPTRLLDEPPRPPTSIADKLTAIGDPAFTAIYLGERRRAKKLGGEGATVGSPGTCTP